MKRKKLSVGILIVLATTNILVIFVAAGLVSLTPPDATNAVLTTTNPAGTMGITGFVSTAVNPRIPHHYEVELSISLGGSGNV